jgi:hypothetical protein
VAKNVTINTKSKYQKFVAVSGAVWIICLVDQSHAIAFVSSSGKRVTHKEKPISMRINLKNIAVAKTPFCFEATNEGIKAWVNAPSAKIRLNRFGSLKATKNISV